MLKNGTDYTVGYGTNKSVGKGYVTITGKGKYGGKVTKTFSILPRTTSISAKSTKRGKLSFTVTKRSEATKYQTYYVRVRTVKTVGKTNYYSGWSSVKKATVK